MNGFFLKCILSNYKENVLDGSIFEKSLGPWTSRSVWRIRQNQGPLSDGRSPNHFDPRVGVPAPDTDRAINGAGYTPNTFSG